MGKRCDLVLFCVLLLAASGWAQGASATVAGTADEVVAAHKVKDAGRLAAIAGRNKPDPWEVADVLCQRGEYAAAEAFSLAAPRVDVETLPAYVTAARGRAAEPGAREAYRKSMALDAAKHPGQVLEVLGSVKADRKDILSTLVWFQRAWAYQDLRRPADAIRCWRRAGDIALTIGWLSQAEMSFNGAGHTAFATGHPDIALACNTRQLEISRKRGNGPGVAYALGNIGLVYRQRADVKSARKYLEESLALARQLKMTAWAAKVRLNLIPIYTQHAEYGKAAATGEAAQRVFEQAGDRLNLARVLQEIGGMFRHRGETVRAKEQLQHAHGILISMGRTHDAAVCSVNLAGIDAEVGDVSAAMKKHRAAIRVFESAHDRHRTARSRAALAGLHRRIGEFDKALPLLRGSLEILQQIGDKNGIASTLGSLGDAFADTGRADLAFSHYDRSLRHFREIGSPQGEAMTLRRIGNLRWTLGEQEQGEATLRRALAIYEKMNNRRHAAAVLGGLAIMRTSVGEHEEAVADLRRVLVIYREMDNRIMEANATTNLGGTLVALARYREALGHIQRALELETANRNAAEVANLLGLLGVTHQGLGQTKKAEQYFDRSIEAAEKAGATGVLVRNLGTFAWMRYHQRDTPGAVELARRALAELPTLVRGLGEEQGASARGTFSNLFEIGCLASLHAGDTSSLSLFVENGRAGGLLESLGGRDTLRGSVVPRSLRLDEETALHAARKAEERYRKALATRKRKATRTARKELRKTRAALLEVAQRIRREAKLAAKLLYPEANGIDEIRAALRPGEALVSYALFPHGSLALVLTQAGARAVDLGPTKTVELACRALKLHDAELPAAGAIAHLRETVAAPLKLPPEVKRVLLSPHGPLSYVPGALLFPKREVVHVPSGTLYVLLASQAEAPGDGVFAMGAPDYSGRRLDPLPQTGVEARAVGTTVLVGKKATEAGLRAALSGGRHWRSLHFACHGLVDPERPRLSALALTREGADDGLLTVLEVYRMECPAELVVLSACETGRGKIYNAEGVVGFTGAFLFAGAPRVLVSLWKVDDHATRALMVKFYDLWNRSGGSGTPAAAALKHAQAFVRSQPKWKHPYYWAAWQLWGLPN